MKDEDRAITLLKACRDLLQKQMDANYVLNILTETVYYDDADCCGACLLDDINCLLKEMENTYEQRR
jgi:hypothetical protein